MNKINNLKSFIKEDKINEREMRIMSPFFGKNGDIKKVQCCDLFVTDILSEGWYNLEGKDLDYVSITGDISHPYKN